MALVKTTKILNGKTKIPVIAAKAASSPAPKTVARTNGTKPSKATITERVAAATEQLASGITESSAAAEELRRSMEQIAAGAEEAAGASQEQLAAIKRVIVNLGTARGRAGQRYGRPATMTPARPARADRVTWCTTTLSP